METVPSQVKRSLILALTSGALLLTLPVLGWPAQAQVSCANAQTTIELRQCTAQEYQAADRRLNQVYQQLTRKLKVSQRQRLVTAQRAWIQFRDQSCDYEQGVYEGGSFAPVARGQCMTQMTRKRIADLEGYLRQADR